MGEAHEKYPTSCLFCFRETPLVIYRRHYKKTYMFICSKRQGYRPPGSPSCAPDAEQKMLRKCFIIKFGETLHIIFKRTLQIGIALKESDFFFLAVFNFDLD